METHNYDSANQSMDAGNRKDLEPGRDDRNLLATDNTEAPVDTDKPMIKSVADEGGDEHYTDEELNDPNYFEDRAGDNVRK